MLQSPIWKFSVNFFKDEMRGMDSGHCLTGWLSYSPPNTFRFIYIICGLNKRYPPPPTLLYKGVVVMYLWRRTERIRIRLYTLYKYHIDGSVVWKETLPAQGKQISWLGWTHTCENCPEVCTISPHLWELSWGVYNESTPVRIVLRCTQVAHTCENCPEVYTISPHPWEISWGVHN